MLEEVEPKFESGESSPVDQAYLADLAIAVERARRHNVEVDELSASGGSYEKFAALQAAYKAEAITDRDKGLQKIAEQVEYRQRFPNAANKIFSADSVTKERVDRGQRLQTLKNKVAYFHGQLANPEAVIEREKNTMIERHGIYSKRINPPTVEEFVTRIQKQLAPIEAEIAKIEEQLPK
jgi:hypothetical protein